MIVKTALPSFVALTFAAAAFAAAVWIVPKGGTSPVEMLLLTGIAAVCTIGSLATAYGETVSRWRFHGALVLTLSLLLALVEGIYMGALGRFGNTCLGIGLCAALVLGARLLLTPKGQRTGEFRSIVAMVATIAGFLASVGGPGLLNA